jgi:hypothetical protein
MSEKPVHPRPRRLVDWINPAGAKKVHSLMDKVYFGPVLVSQRPPCYDHSVIALDFADRKTSRRLIGPEFVRHRWIHSEGLAAGSGAY